MSGIRSVTRRAAQQGYAADGSAPLRVDSADNKLKIIPAGSGTTELEVLQAYAPVASTGTALTVTKALHANKIVYVNRAAGQLITLPAASGSGDKYTFVIGATTTGATTISVASALDYMIGTATLYQDGGDTVVGFATANTGTVATESDTITLFVASNTTGGIKGAVVRLTDVASAVWLVEYISDAGGTEATPFSAAV